MPTTDLDEARRILTWRHDLPRQGRAVLIEGPLSTSIGGHRLVLRMDRLDAIQNGFLLAEYKTGRRVDPELVRVQLAVLAYAVAAVFDMAPIRWELELLGARRVVPLEAETRTSALRGFAQDLALAVARGEREPRPYDPAFCSRCPAQAYCPRVSPNPKSLPRKVSTPDTQLVLFP